MSTRFTSRGAWGLLVVCATAFWPSVGTAIGPYATGERLAATATLALTVAGAYVAARYLDGRASRPIGPWLRASAVALAVLAVIVILVVLLAFSLAIGSLIPWPREWSTVLVLGAAGIALFVFSVATLRALRWGAVGMVVTYAATNAWAPEGVDSAEK
jgi:hypothetical protein